MRTRHAASALAVVIGALVIVPSARAHHSFAPHFDASKPVSISGTITRFEAQNPHSYIHIAAVDESGKTRDYVCESHGVTQLSRNGVTPQLLKVGTKIRVTGSLSRHSPYMCFFNTVELSDGRTLSVNGPTGPRPAAAIAPRKDIFGTWLLAPIPNRGTSGPQPMIQFLTPAGEKAVAAYDPFKDDPTFRCDPVAIRRVWGAPGTPLEIVRDGSDVVLHHEWMDVRRVIHMNMKEHPKSGPRSSLGHSIGRWEGDTLVIDTANYSAGVLNQYVEQPGQPTKGLLHSAALTSIERLHLDPARQRLVVEIDLADPDFFKQPFQRSTNEYAPSALKIERFNCSPEGVTGTLKK
ncbi:MAG TPA: DUF6152 family protein [Vicinamibacterales bacterium]|nr:DUF6152 family protein [Vicinamibacterales bacterium]